MSTLICEFTAVTATLPGNNTVESFHYAGTTQQFSALMAKSTPKAVNAHQSAFTVKHAPVGIAATAASTGGAGNTDMTASVSFNPMLFFLGLFLLAISIAMVWFILKRAGHKIELNEFVS
ncbi:hypothetical protein [Dictyobacter aurantiacus]|uniref:Uncharacterized protein n=1 Tax=Dictyobacter aurantiacus TaxID=1936993 RepID=A0A401ZPG6_9CHLR|nr:hypothetical protein [Dictyobacter aurantiacus]GCE08684.1 hypothetical protein KDAU_60130 [Dictyobacter aurantiacus]